MSTETRSRLYESVKSIAESLSGGFRDEWRKSHGWTLDDEEVWQWDEDASDYGDEYGPDSDELSWDDEDGGPMPMIGWAAEWIDDPLDMSFTVGADGQYRSATLLVAFGGPNIEVHTRNSTVEGVWWGEAFTMRYDDVFDIDGDLAEWWEDHNAGTSYRGL